MELDKRIKEGKRPLTCFDIEEAKQFVGKKGYFSDYLNVYTNLCNMQEDVLESLDEHHDEAFVETCAKWEFFLPAEWVKEPEKKYRAFTNEEFLNLFDAGKLHSIRKKNERGRYIITEIYFNDDCEKDTVYVKLNHCDAGFAMRYLVNNDFEYFDGKEWKIFGVGE